VKEKKIAHNYYNIHKMEKDYKKFKERLIEIDSLSNREKINADQTLILSLAAIFDYHKPDYDKLKESLVK